MSAILVTGASGLIGKAVCESLTTKREVIGLSRAKPRADFPFVQGDFTKADDLRRLDEYELDAIIHLGAVTGGGKEPEFIPTNVEGTRNLLRYGIGRGVRKFVLASSIATVGMEDVSFRPLELPMPDEHPCLDVCWYGFSKYMMEQLTRHLSRQHPEIDIINLRLAAVPAPDKMSPPPDEPPPLSAWTVGHLTHMHLNDAVRVFTLAAQSPVKPGVRIMNACAKNAWTKVPVAEVLRSWWGDEVDLSWYQQPGHELDGLFDVKRIEDELGFVAQTPF